MSFQINIDGEIFPEKEARIPVLDRGFLYGDSVYEVLRTYQGRLFAFDEHLARLERSANRLDILLPDQIRLKQEVQRTLQVAANPESYCRIIVTRGAGPIGLDPNLAKEPRLVILVKDYEHFPEWMYQQGIKVTIPSVHRTAPNSLDPAIKSGNYLNSVLALGEARKNGYDDALMLGSHGRITEATSSNVFVFADGILKTPTLETGILPGITREFLLQLAHENGIPAKEEDLFPEDLYRADEVMLTSTLKEVMPIFRVGEQSIGNQHPGPMAKKLRTWFQNYVSSQIKKSDSHLQQ